LKTPTGVLRLSTLEDHDLCCSHELRLASSLLGISSKQGKCRIRPGGGRQLDR